MTENYKIAALYVETDGCYFGLPNVDPWDETRDARLYAGPHPVVAHPPCQRWGKMWAGQPLWIKRTGQRKKKGDDSGCFKAALATVRKYGGVLEHPMNSHAWAHFGLKKPPREGGWIKADHFGGWTCCIEQGRYGHYAPKPTWLYAVGCELPELRWGKYEVQDSDFPAWAMEKYGREKCRKAGLLAFKGGGKDSTARIHTPPEFRDLLLKMAGSAVKIEGQKMTENIFKTRPICPDCEQELTDKEIKRKQQTCTICQQRLRVRLQMELGKPLEKKP